MILCLYSAYTSNLDFCAYCKKEQQGFHSLGTMTRWHAHYIWWCRRGLIQFMDECKARLWWRRYWAPDHGKGLCLFRALLLVEHCGDSMSNLKRSNGNGMIWKRMIEIRADRNRGHPFWGLAKQLCVLLQMKDFLRKAWLHKPSSAWPSSSFHVCSQTPFTCSFGLPQHQIVSLLAMGPDKRWKAAAGGKAREPDTSQQGTRSWGLHPSRPFQPSPAGSYQMDVPFCSVLYVRKWCLSVRFLLVLCLCFFGTMSSFLTQREKCIFWHVLPLAAGTELLLKHGMTSKDLKQAGLKWKNGRIWATFSC